MSDVTKDGALSFAEFCTAMHLVVLRVRNFDLPDQLPAKLQPYAPLIDFNSESNLNSTSSTSNAASKSNQEFNEESMLNVSDSEDNTLGSPVQSTLKFLASSNTGNNSQQSSENKPVHFGVKPQIQSDIQIAHPVALRINPNQLNQQQQQQQISSNSNQQAFLNPNQNIETQTNPAGTTGLIPEPPPRHSRSSSLGAINQNQSNAGSSSQSIIPPPPQTQQQATPAMPTALNNTPKILQQQPPVPPRITSPPTIYNQQQHHNHAQDQANLTLLPPPPPPLPHHHSYHQSRILSIQQQHHHHAHNLVQVNSTPTANTVQTHRAAPSIPVLANSAQSQTTEEITKSIEKLVEQMSLVNFERLRKINENKNQPQQCQDQAGILVESIRAQTEQNQVLRRVFNELEKELRSLTDQRIALEIKLDYLNTSSNSSVATNSISNSLSTPSINLGNSAANTPAINQSNTVVQQSSSNQISIKKHTNSAVKTIGNVTVIPATPIATQGSNHNTVTATPVLTNSNNSNGQITNKVII